MPDDIKIELINRIEEIYIKKQQLTSTSGFRLMSNGEETRKYKYSIMASLSDENLIEYLKRGMVKINLGLLV